MLNAAVCVKYISRELSADEYHTLMTRGATTLLFNQRQIIFCNHSSSKGKFKVT